MKHRIAVALCLLLFFTLGIYCAQAQELPDPQNRFATLRLLLGDSLPGSPVDHPSFLMGIDIKLQKGWKVYWRSPGDAGQPLTVDWKSSANISDVQLEWPVPTRFVEEWGLEVFGYKDEVVFPLKVQRENASQPAHAKFQLHYAVCSDICVPYDDVLEMNIPPTWKADAADRSLLNAFADTLPKTNGADGLMIKEAVREEETAEKGVLRVVAESSARRFVSPDVFVEAETGLRFPKPKLHISAGGRRAEFRFPYEITLPGNTLAEKTVTLTFSDAHTAVETSMVIPKGFAAKGEEAPEQPQAPIAWFLLLALAGGFLLNFMPCVLPVLSIKLMALLKQGSADKSVLRRSFAATALGIVLSFLALAVIAILAKQAGQAVGWGFHFQQPMFLIALTLVMVLFASKLWDLYEIHLPIAVSTRIAHSATKEGWLGDVASGAFATLLATPCSAPILGTAIGFALSRGAFEICVIFLALGVGMAAPYLLGIAFPALMKLLPKPGRWMQSLKHVMGAFLLLTAAWLLWILAQQVGMQASAVVLVLALLMILVLWLGRHRTRRFFIIVAVACLAAAAFMVPKFMVASAVAPSALQNAQNLWQPFELKKIATLVAQGKTVVVDVTAKWCLTCAANELWVWNSQEVSSALHSSSVVAMRADWTSPNQDINAYLASFGRYGIPFAVIYGPGFPEGETLPELLTKTLVIDGIREAEHKP